MLVLSRRTDEEIIIGETIRIVIQEIRGDRVRVGIECPRDVPVYRREIKDRIDEERRGQR